MKPAILVVNLDKTKVIYRIQKKGVLINTAKTLKSDENVARKHFQMPPNYFYSQFLVHILNDNQYRQLIRHRLITSPHQYVIELEYSSDFIDYKG